MHAFLRAALLVSTTALCGSAAASSLVCTVQHSTRNPWATGFVADVLVTNAGTAPVTGWQVDWSYTSPVTLVGAPWRAVVTIKGKKLSAVDDGENPAIPGGGSVDFGMSLSYTSASAPTLKSISVDGVGCVVADSFFADPDSTAAAWTLAHPSDGRTPDIQAQIVARPGARWFGDWSGDIGPAVAAYVGAAETAKRTPIVVAYDIPQRDCGSYSAGGATSAAAYKQWISGFAAGVGARKAVVVLEPDALPQIDCLSAADQTQRLNLLQYATKQFKTKAPNAKVYLDIGHPGWLSVADAASRLTSAGVANARGFSLNVSNFHTTDENTGYGDQVAAQLSLGGLDRRYVIDTSRNGKGPLGTQWCDPAGRQIGSISAENLAAAGAEMTLWIKNPGNADGCAAPAGTFDPQLAYDLIHGY